MYNHKCPGSKSNLFVLEKIAATYNHSGYSIWVELPTHPYVLCSIPPLFDYTIISRCTLEFWGIWVWLYICVRATKARGNGENHEKSAIISLQTWWKEQSKVQTLPVCSHDRCPVVKNIQVYSNTQFLKMGWFFMGVYALFFEVEIQTQMKPHIILRN